MLDLFIYFLVREDLDGRNKYRVFILSSSNKSDDFKLRVEQIVQRVTWIWAHAYYQKTKNEIYFLNRVKYPSQISRKLRRRFLPMLLSHEKNLTDKICRAPKDEENLSVRI